MEGHESDTLPHGMQLFGKAEHRKDLFIFMKRHSHTMKGSYA